MPKKTPAKKKRPGRPATGKTPIRSIRVPDEMWERWKATAEKAGKGVTAWIIERCERRPTAELDPRLLGGFVTDESDYN